MLDAIVVGDVVIDAFIKLKKENAKIIRDEDQEWLAMPFGQKLQFEEAQILPGVGNSANVAVSFSRLGFLHGTRTAFPLVVWRARATLPLRESGRHRRCHQQPGRRL